MAMTSKHPVAQGRSCLHEILHIAHGLLLTRLTQRWTRRLEARDHHVPLGVLPRMQHLPVVQQVKELPAVDLIEGDEDSQVGILLRCNTFRPHCGLAGDSTKEILPMTPIC